MRCWKGLNKNAASGVDKVTAKAYEENLQVNIQSLEKRLKDKRYRAKLVRRCYIPKKNGKERPLGIPALEDRLLQLACAKILASIFESDFVGTSYGYRPNRSAKEAIEDLKFNLQLWLKVGILDSDGKIIHPESEASRGGIVSPVLGRVGRGNLTPSLLDLIVVFSLWRPMHALPWR
jgi:RNA-directed DNA polymerase